MSRVKGGCLCGAIRYTLKAAPQAVVLCHCTHCQKSSGSAFSTNVVVPEGDIAFEGAAPKSYADKGESGLAVHRQFCSNCGSSIGTVAAGLPGMYILKAGSLDDASAVNAVGAEIWTRSQQPWVRLGIECQSFEKGFPG